MPSSPSAVSPASRYIQLCGREVHYLEWGERGQPPLIMWHGVARTARDFDDIASAMAHERHIIAPDMIGRGFSEWSPDPEAEYTVPFYAKQARELLDALQFGQVDWLGTSMGGLVAMEAAATTLPSRIRRLVLNDIGPVVAPAAVERIRAYADAPPPRFNRMSELENYFRTVYAPFGPHTEQQWRRLAETSARRLPDGGVTPHFDPAIKIHFSALTTPDVIERQWRIWRDLDCEMLCLRGENSDLLLVSDTERMMRENRNCKTVTIAGCGHAPALNVPAQIGLVEEFFNKGHQQGSTS